MGGRAAWLTIPPPLQLPQCCYCPAEEVPSRLSPTSSRLHQSCSNADRLTPSISLLINSDCIDNVGQRSGCRVHRSEYPERRRLNVGPKNPVQAPASHDVGFPPENARSRVSDIHEFVEPDLPLREVNKQINIGITTRFVPSG
jgi:hypothetical protein